MRILIVGASGFIGSSLMQSLKNDGHEVVAFDRAKASWNLEGYDAIINLAGETLFSLRWSRKKQQAIYSSRVELTKKLACAIQQLQRPPKIFISASAIGFYGNRGDEYLTETSAGGQGFLAEVCKKWEEAAKGICRPDVTVTLLRLGVVLDKKGGALAKMVPSFRLGLGATIGNGSQWMSWIGLQDLTRIIQFLLKHPIGGPINAVNPYPLTNKKFTKELAASLHRPAFMRIPSPLVRLLFGKMGDEVLLTSQRVIPQRLLDSGFQFSQNTLSDL